MSPELSKGGRDKHWLAYILAAGATLGAGEAADAEVVFTEVNLTLSNSFVDTGDLGGEDDLDAFLDLNGDGQTDFVLVQLTIQFTDEGDLGPFPPGSSLGFALVDGYQPENYVFKFPYPSESDIEYPSDPLPGDNPFSDDDPFDDYYPSQVDDLLEQFAALDVGAIPLCAGQTIGEGLVPDAKPFGEGKGEGKTGLLGFQKEGKPVEVKAPGEPKATTKVKLDFRVGSFRGVQRKCLGVAFDIDGERHYGFLTLSVAEDLTSVTLHSFAFETEPDTPIICGELFAADRRFAIERDTTLPIELPAVDGNGSPVDPAGVDFVIESLPANGELTGNGPFRTYRPNTGFTGTDVFRYRIDDSVGTITIVVGGVPGQPGIRRRASKKSDDCSVAPGEGNPWDLAPLGALALGAFGLRQWRRRKEERLAEARD